MDKLFGPSKPLKVIIKDYITMALEIAYGNFRQKTLKLKLKQTNISIMIMRRQAIRIFQPS